MDFSVIGIDLAKNVFQVCGLNRAGKVVFNKTVSRKKLPETIQQLPPSLLAMEACGTANHWARAFAAMGHEIRLIPAQHVKPFVRGNKNDANDALAICEAALRPGIKPVPVKTIEQQELQMLLRVRQRHVQQATAIANQIRAFLREQGIALPVSLPVLLKELPLVLEDAENGLNPISREVIAELDAELRELRARIKTSEQRIKQWSTQSEDCQRLMTIPGYGPIVATALLAAIGNASQFKNGRQLAAWAGLTPTHTGSGGKTTVLGTRPMNNHHLRYLLIHGARAVVRWCQNKDDRLSRWLQTLIARRGKHKAIVALANKCARIAWVLLTRKDEFRVQTTAAVVAA